MKPRNRNHLKFVLLFLSLLGAPYNSEAAINSGIYKTLCKRGLLKEQVYRNQQVQLAEAFFQEDVCTQTYLTFYTQGEVQYEENSPLNINFVYQKIFISLEHDGLVEDFNNRQVCGFSNWKMNQKQEITGLMCAIFNSGSASKIPSAGEVRYGLYLIKNNFLYYGKMSRELDSSTPAKRPQEIDFTTEYTFQNPL